VHNVVNKSLKKPIFDCSKIGDFYKCGCAEEEGSNKGGEEGGPAETKIAVQRTAKQTEDGGDDLVPVSPRGARMKLEREG